MLDVRVVFRVRVSSPVGSSDWVYAFGVPQIPQLQDLRISTTCVLTGDLCAVSVNFTASYPIPPMGQIVIKLPMNFSCDGIQGGWLNEVWRGEVNISCGGGESLSCGYGCMVMRNTVVVTRDGTGMAGLGAGGIILGGVKARGWEGPNVGWRCVCFLVFVWISLRDAKLCEPWALVPDVLSRLVLIILSTILCTRVCVYVCIYVSFFCMCMCTCESVPCDSCIHIGLHMQPCLHMFMTARGRIVCLCFNIKEE